MTGSEGRRLRSNRRRTSSRRDLMRIIDLLIDKNDDLTRVYIAPLEKSGIYWLPGDFTTKTSTGRSRPEPGSINRYEPHRAANRSASAVPTQLSWTRSRLLVNCISSELGEEEEGERNVALTAFYRLWLAPSIIALHAPPSYHCYSWQHWFTNRTIWRCVNRVIWPLAKAQKKLK